MSFKVNFAWLRSNAVWHIIFILIILYSVSSINVLILAVGILPFLMGAFLNTRVLTYFAEISFGIAALLSIFHLSLIFRSRKRKNDLSENNSRAGIAEIWGRIRLSNKVLFFIIVFYGLVSVYYFLWHFGVAGKIFSADDEIIYIFFAIFSFAHAIIVSSFNLATLILRQKRAADRKAYEERLAEQKAINAKTGSA